MENYWFWIFIFISAVVIFTWDKSNQLKTEIERRKAIEKTYNESLKEVTQLEKAQEELKKELIRQLTAIEIKERLYKVWNTPPSERANALASQIADYTTLYMEISARYLERKKHPAKKEAKRIRDIKRDYKSLQAETKIIEYKVESIFSLFPELETYFEDFESLNDLYNLKNLNELSETHDRVRDYISKEEYDRLSSTDRNQLALNNYISSHNKSKWQIGRDYEMSVGHNYEEDGWEVEYTGIIRGLDDLGRDLVCKKDNKTEIVQCKYWSSKKEIHEKHIFQLYGTTVIYNLDRGDLFSPEATAVLVTNIKLSDRARKFAKALNIKLLESRTMTSFPRVKCNIGRNEAGGITKIYHLPMDQHYDRTTLKLDTCFLVNTVAHAEEQGFRRSYKWRGKT